MAVVKNDDAKTMPVNRIVDKVAIATGGGTINLRNYGGVFGRGEPGLVARPTTLVRAKR